MPDIAIRVKPRSSRSGILGVKEGVWQVAVHSPPEGGKANKEILEILAKALGIAPSLLEITSGQKSRQKRVSVQSLTEQEIDRALSEAVTSTGRR